MNKLLFLALFILGCSSGSASETDSGSAPAECLSSEKLGAFSIACGKQLGGTFAAETCKPTAPTPSSCVDLAVSAPTACADGSEVRIVCCEVP